MKHGQGHKIHVTSFSVFHTEATVRTGLKNLLGVVTSVVWTVVSKALFARFHMVEHNPTI